MSFKVFKRKPRQKVAEYWRFTPKEDITIHELATILRYTRGNLHTIRVEAVDLQNKVFLQIKRHFTFLKDEYE